MFYNTGISTYVWVLSNKKAPERKGKVQLINGVNLCGKMRKSLGSKRNEMDESDIATVIRAFGSFAAVEAYELDKQAAQKSTRGRPAATPKVEVAKTFASKIFSTHEFGYRRINIERPLRLSYQFSDKHIAECRFAPGVINAAMQWLYDEYSTVEGESWNDGDTCKRYGDLSAHEDAIRRYFKLHFADLKEKHIKDLLNRSTWLDQKRLLLKARSLQAIIGAAQHDDMNTFDDALKTACKQQGIALDTKEKKQITEAVSWKNPLAAKVIKKVHKTKANPLYGLFAVNGEVLEYLADNDLRDNENVPLDPSQSVNAVNEAYFLKEVQPHVPDAWIDASKKDVKDQQVGIVGYEIPFNRHFYQYQPPRDLLEIDADLDTISAEIMQLLQEVHS
jgi:type I restriction enzyme M protein